MFLALLNLGTLVILWKKTDQKPVVHHIPSGGIKDKLATDLSLTDAQYEAFKKMVEKHKAIMRKLGSEIQEARKDYFGLLGANADESTAGARLRRIGDLQMKIEKATVDHFLELKASLTPEQAQRFEEIYADALRMMIRKPMGPPPHHRGGPHGHHPPPPPH